MQQILTNEEILQAQLISDFWYRLSKCFEDNTDNELKINMWDAQEEQNGKKIKAIRDEMNRRNREL